MHSLRLLFSELGPFRRPFRFVFLAGFLDGVAMFLFPLVLAEYTSRKISAVGEIFALLITLYAVSLVLQWVIRRYGETMGGELALHLRERYFAALESLPLKEFSKFHSGYALSLIGRVSDGLGGILVEMFWGVAKSAANLSLFFLFTARESSAIAWANFALLTIFILVSTFLSRRMVPIAQETNIRRSSLMGRYADFASNMLTVKKLSLRAFAEERLKRESRSTLQQLRVFQRFHAWRWSLLHSLYGAAYLLTICFLVQRVSLGESNPGILILFISTFTTVRNHVERLSEGFKSLLELNADLKTLDGIVTLTGATDLGGPVPEWKRIQFSEIQFRHAGQQSIVRVPEFSLSKGEWVGITGESGQGKSTFLNLLSNFLHPLEGERRVDALSFEEYPPEFFQKMVAFVSQEVELFNLSIRENLLLGRERSDEELNRYLEELGLLDWLQKLESGLNSVVGEKGMKLSSGQKQRINLIRATLLEREIYLLDEPTSHLDRENASRVEKFIEKRLRGKSLVIVSHSPGILGLCNRVYRFQDHMMLRDLPDEALAE